MAYVKRMRLFWWLLILLSILSGCSATKYLKEDQRFYAGSLVKLEPVGKVGPKKALKKNLESLIVPAPNTEIFGMRPGVWLYFRQRDATKKKGLKALISRKFGQVPILISGVKPEQTAKLLEGTLQNDGYFGSQVKFDIKDRPKKKEAVVVYRVKLHPPYKLRNIQFPTPKDSMYTRVLQAIPEKTLLKERQRYDLARLQAEQERVEKEVENFGLFYFDDRYLVFEADSTVGEKQIDVRLRLEEGVPQKVKTIYKLGEVNIYPDYTLDADTVSLKQQVQLVDSFKYHDLTHKFRPKAITKGVNLRRGNIYRSMDHSLTVSHLMDLGVFKFVNVQYAEMFPDSNLLQSNIYLTPLKRRSMRAEFQATTKSNSFAGPGLELTFTDRNFLHGAELLQVRLNSSYEVQIGRKITGPLNSFEVGVETSLSIPRFITPIRVDFSSKKYLPKTDFRVGYNVQNRVGFFRLNNSNISAGYTWRESEAKSHELYPIDISFVKTGKKSPEFQEILDDNPFLERSFEDQFILGTRYSYTLNTQLKQDLVGEFEERKLKTHSLFFTGTVQTAGNLISAIQGSVENDSDGDGINEIFNTAYSQYVRGDIDFRHYWQLDKHNKLATRLIVGAGYAYGNSNAMPYIKQFSIGGSNSLRAFPARSLGPGSYSVTTDPAYAEELPTFIDQRGDIKLEGNVEFRFDIFKALKGALFVDAGNIWLMDNPPPNSLQGLGKFDKDTFVSEIALGTGIGLRFDFNFFVLRFDTAFPLRKPFLPEEERWVVDEIDFDSANWRSENLIFNIGIGYPF